MSDDRRAFLRAATAALAATPWTAGAAVAAGAAGAAPRAATEPTHDMSGMPASWQGHEQIAMLMYPGFTALDFVGPHYMLSNLMGAKVHLVAKTMAPVMSDTGLAIAPTTTLGRAPKALDILFVPGGGQGTLNAMKDRTLIRWVAERASRAKLVASVCTGSLVLGQAGLLHGKRATSHWATRALLGEFGATAVDERVVWDGALVTGAGVSAGLDLGLQVVAKLRDDSYAQSVQLLAEYAPQPPFNAGTPATAPAEVHQMMNSMFDGLIAQMRAVSRSALPGPVPG